MVHRQLKSLVWLIAGMWLVAIPLSSLLSADDQPTAQPADSKGAALLVKCIDGIRENYARIPAVRCKAVMITVDPNVKEAGTLRFTRPDGGSTEIYQSPKSTQEMDLILAGEDLRVDLNDVDMNERSAVAMHNGIWTAYSPIRNWAGRWWRDDMGGYINLDPRNVGSSGQRENVLHQLSKLRVTGHETTNLANEERLVLNLERSVPNADIVVKSCWEFDPRRNYLPRRILNYHTRTGKINDRLDIEYQAVIPDKAWFLSKSTQTFFGKDGADTPDQKTFNQQTTVEIPGPVKIEDSIPATAFEIQMDPATRVSDNTRKRPPTKPRPK